MKQFFATTFQDAPLMVAETRMGVRKTRPNIELCRDPAVFRLGEEVREIESNIERLVKILEEPG